MRSNNINKADGKERIKALGTGISNINAMGRNQEYTFHLNPDYKGNGGVTNAIGKDVYINYNLNIQKNTKFGDITIEDNGIRAHEIKHGFQIMNGNLLGSKSDPTYDKTDESEANQLQLAVSGSLNFPTGKNSSVKILSMSRVNPNLDNIYDTTKNSYIYRSLPQESKNVATYVGELVDKNDFNNKLEAGWK